MDAALVLRLTRRGRRQGRHLALVLEQPIGQAEAQTWISEARTPPFEMREGPHTLRLAPAGPGISPRAAGEGADDRPLTVTIFELEVESPP